MCIKDILTVDTGRGPQQYCGGETVANMSSGSEITMRIETYPTTNANINCMVQIVTGPNLNEHMNVRYPEEDSSEFGVAPGRKPTTCECGRANKVNFIGKYHIVSGKYGIFLTGRTLANSILVFFE